MLKLLLPVFLLLAWGPHHALAQRANRPTYLQIFFVGPHWLTGHEVLHYSPAFNGKTGETVPEPDSLRFLSPGALALGLGTLDGDGQPTAGQRPGSAGTVPNGQAWRPAPPAEDGQPSQRTEQKLFDRMNNLVEARATLARTTLTNALNEAAAAGWEVVQLTSSGPEGGLVYLLKRR